MERQFYLRGQLVTVNELEDVRAVRVPEDARAAFAEGVGIRGQAVDLGEIEESRGVPAAVADAFRNAGWIFVRPTAMPAARDLGGEPVEGRVLVTEDGRAMIGTDRLTLRLRDSSPEERVRGLAEEEGLEILRPLSFTPEQRIFLVRARPGRDVLDLARALTERTQDVLYAEPELVEHVPGRYTPTDPDYARQWQHPTVGLPVAWDQTLGRDIRVAVIDNGFDLTHADLQPAIVTGAVGYFKETLQGPVFVQGLGTMPAGAHGTFCAGMVAARANNGVGGCGSAPECNLVPIACLRDQVGSQVTLARAVGYAIAPMREINGTAEPGADVISCSLGPAGVRWRLQSVLEDALRFASSHGRGGLGTPVFWAVDNETVPISWDEVSSHAVTIAVGRLRLGDLADGSAFGPELDLLAPGVHVHSTRPGNQHGAGTGTSYATPFTAGVAALALSLNPSLRDSSIRLLLRETCAKVGPVAYVGGRNDEYGYGRLDAEAAIARAVLSIAS